MKIETKEDIANFIESHLAELGGDAYGVNYIAEKLIEWHESELKYLRLDWVAVKEQLPPINKKVWLYNTENDNYEAEFVNKLDLTTKRYERNWTHWAEVKPPCL